MLNRYELKPLADHCEIVCGPAFSSSQFTYNDYDVPLVKGDNLHQGYIDWANAKRWPRDSAKDYEKYYLQPGDLVVAMDRPWVSSGLKWSYIRSTDPSSLLVQRVARIRGKRTLDQGFLRCLIGSKYFSEYVKPIVTGVNVPHISAKQIGRFYIPLPDIETQQKIAAILTAYDDLIENNRQRIALLEKMAEEIYREWFVRLRFPGHEHTPVHKGVPEGWETKRISQAADRHSFGRLYKEADLYSEGNVIVIDQSVKPYLGFHNNEPDHYADLSDPAILFGDHSCKFALMTTFFSVAENVIPFKSEEPSSTIYLFYAAKGQVETTEYKRHWTTLAKKEIFWPRQALRKSFSQAIAPNIQLSRSLEMQNRLLSKTRDLLLNRLISGKLRVDDLDIQFPPSMQDTA